MVRLDLNELEVNREYIHVHTDNSVTKFTYLGLDTDLLGEHAIRLEDGSESFLVPMDKVFGLAE